MPSWKKVVASGSDASFSSVSVDTFVSASSFKGSFTGSLQGTASQAISSSYALTASFALNGGGGGLSALYIADEGITQGTASYLDFTGPGVVASVSNNTASITISGGGSAGQTTTLTQSLAATTWSLSHNLNTNTPLVQIYDTTYNQIIPQFVSASNATTVIVGFGIPTAGYAVVSTGGTLTVTGSNVILNQPIAATTWSFVHNLNNQYPVFQVFDANNEVVIPQRIVATDYTSSLIYFPSAVSGKAVASVGGYSGSVTASFAVNASSASYAYTASSAISASYAQTASYLLGYISPFPFTGSAQITGSLGVTGSINSTGNITTTGTITAQTLVVQTVTSSIVYSSGSNIFGNALTNTQTMTGSVNITGSLNVVGPITSTNAGFFVSNTSMNFGPNGANSLSLGNSAGVLSLSSAILSLGSGTTTQTNLFGAINVASSLSVTASLNVSGSLTGSNARFSGVVTVQSASLDYGQNLSVATGSYQVIASAVTGSYRCAFFDYVMFSGSVVRAGTVTSTWSGSATEYYENYTADLGGSTSGVVLQTAISSSAIRLQASSSTSAWTIRSLIRLL
jgi:hypothetical protein